MISKFLTSSWYDLGINSILTICRAVKCHKTAIFRAEFLNMSIWVVIDNSRVKLRVGVVYAPQESRTSKEILKNMFSKIEDQIQQAKERQQNVLLMGDFNCKIGNEIKGNRKDVTKGGKQLLKLAKENDLYILNKSEKCRGLWTRCEGGSKSVLEYILIDNANIGAFEHMLIDEEREFSPASYDQNKLTFSDHNVLIAKFNWVMIEAIKEKEKKKEIMTKKGYSRYKNELEKEGVSNILKNKNADGQEIYELWKMKVAEIASRNKTTVKKKNPRKGIKKLIRRKKSIKRKISDTRGEEKKLLLLNLKTINEQLKIEKDRQFHEKITKVVHKLKCKKGINGPNMWEVLKRLRNKKGEPPTTIKSKEGKVLESSEEIKDRYVEHFTEILQPPQATTEEEKQQEEVINIIFNNILKLADSLEPRLTTIEEIKRAKKELKRNKCKDPYGWTNEMLLEGGDEIDQSLLLLFNRMERERFSPKQWREVTIRTIAKQGSILEMDNKRGLFLTEVISKLYEKVLKNRNQDKLDEYISDYQSGGVKGRSPADNTLILSEIIRINKKLNRKTYIVYGDAVKCFDKLWLRDCLVEMYKGECLPQDIQMIYSMNRDTKIEIVTPSGTTKKIDVGEIVKQGTVLGPTLCCIETDQINKVGEDQERMIGDEKVAILIFVDDVMSAGTVENARKSIHNMAEMEKVKKFTYGLKKTKFMVVDSAKGQPEEINEQVKSGTVGETSEYKYVGFWVNKKGNCLLQIEKKKQSLKGEVNGLKSVANYYNVGETFVNVRLEMYEQCILQSLLYNMEAWSMQTKGEIKRLEQIQSKTLCTLLELPKTTPYVALLNELGIWRIEERLIYRKLMFFNNLSNSSDKRLAKRIVVEQEQNNDLDGSFFGSVLSMAKSIHVSIEDLKTLRKDHLKRLLKTKINEKMIRIVASTIPKMKKMRFVGEPAEFVRKPYVINLRGKETIEALRLKLNMVVIYDNYHGDVTIRRLCPHCELHDDTTEHLVDCPVLSSNISSNFIANDNNLQTWKQILEIVSFNINHRDDETSWLKRSRSKKTDC